MAWFLLILAVASNVAANVLFKTAMATAPSSLDVSEVLRFLLTPQLWLGATCCAALLLSYLLALRELDLTLSYAFVISLSLIGITTMSTLLLGEGLSVQRVVAVALIVGGLVLLIADQRAGSKGTSQQAGATDMQSAPTSRT